MAKNFTILGERCSGTNFLQKAIVENFRLEITWQYGWKHFFGHNSYANSDNTIFFSIIRHPLDWVNSFFRNPHHIAGSMRGNIHGFLNDQVVSVYDSGKGKQGRDMIEDYHIHKKRRYHNIFEMRNVKADFQKSMDERVTHHFFLKYEDLRDEYEVVLQEIAELFDLNFVNDKIIPATTYKMTNQPYVPNHQRTFTHIDILNKVDFKSELRYGYDIEAEWKKINS